MPKPTKRAMKRAAKKAVKKAGKAARRKKAAKAAKRATRKAAPPAPAPSATSANAGDPQEQSVHFSVDIETDKEEAQAKWRSASNVIPDALTKAFGGFRMGLSMKERIGIARALVDVMRDRSGLINAGLDCGAPEEYWKRSGGADQIGKRTRAALDALSLLLEDCMGWDTMTGVKVEARMASPEAAADLQQKQK